MVVTQKKRNPFKRATLNSSAKSSPQNGSNALSHLTEKVIGLGSEDISTPTPSSSSSVATPIESSNDTTPKNVKENLPTNNFISWFNSNKDDLMEEFPDITSAELTKFAMRKFKASSSVTPKNNAKRKLDESDGKISGVSKLAKFGFNKI